MKMLPDLEPIVRKWLARYGTDRVRAGLLEQHENNPDVLLEIAKWGNVQIRNRVLPLGWEDTDLLCKIAPYLGSRGLRILEKHPDMSVRFEAAMHGSQAQGRRFLDSIEDNKSSECWLMRESLLGRLDELDKVKTALLGGAARTLKYAEMER